MEWKKSDTSQGPKQSVCSLTDGVWVFVRCQKFEILAQTLMSRSSPNIDVALNSFAHFNLLQPISFGQVGHHLILPV